MNIGLDFDGVIADSTGIKLNLAKELFGATIKPNQWRRDIILGEKLLAEDAYDHVQELVYGSDEYGFKLTPIVGALDSINILLQSNHTLTIVTSRVEHKLEIAEKWARTHDIALPLIGAGRNKSKAPYLEGFDIFVDDGLQKLLHVVDTVKHCFLFDQPYNSDEALHEKIIRVYDWADFMKKIEAL